MTITITGQCTDPDAALDGLRCHLDHLLGMDPAEWFLGQLERAVLDVHTARPLLVVPVPRVGGPGCLSTDPCAHEKMSHPRTSVRSEGRRS